MGNRSSHAALSKAVRRAESRLGRVTVESRYHRLPRRLEDDYQVDGEVLGSGASGTVVRATSRHTGAQVAVKALQLHGLTESKRQDLVSEVEVFLSLDHPHVARLLEVYESESTLSLVMECMEGGELFERVSERKVFAEKDAAEACWQILLAVNYLHSEGIVHRDLKLENVLYEDSDTDYLKVIDFGFSRKLEKSRQNRKGGTMAYVAPEVLTKGSTDRSDLWSIGVIVFILLAGYMPFAGHTDAEKAEAIRQGRYTMKSKRWCHISETACDFVQRLLVVSPERRLTAQQALEHPWIVDRRTGPECLRTTCVDERIADSLVGFTQLSGFRRGCMQLMAWCLSREERMQVREAFLELDLHHTGAIQVSELRRVLHERLHVSEDACCNVAEAFKGLDGDTEGKIHYSDFLAAMMSSRLALHDELLHETFRRFDVGNCGYLTLSGLHQVLGKTREVDATFEVVDQDHDGKLSLKDLMAFLYSEDPSWTCPPAAHVDTKERPKRIQKQRKSYRRMATSKAKSLFYRCSAGKPSSPAACQTQEQATAI